MQPLSEDEFEAGVVCFFTRFKMASDRRKMREICAQLHAQCVNTISLFYQYPAGTSAWVRSASIVFDP